MKIIHVCQYYNDGYGYQENLLPQYQQKLGHNVLVVTSDRTSHFGPAKKTRKVNTGISKDNGVSVLRLPIRGQYRGRFVFFKGLKYTLEKEKPDYIFHHGLTAPSIIICAIYKLKNPNVFLVADNHADYHNSGKAPIYRTLYYRFLWRNILRFFFKYIDKLYSITESCRLFAEKELYAPRAKHSILFLGADVLSSFFSPEWRSRIRNMHGFTDNHLVVVTAGKIDQLKKTDILIRAIKKQETSRLRLLIIGEIEADYEEALDILIDGDNRIIKIGWVESKKLYKYFSASDLAIFPGSQSAIWQQTISCELPLIIRYSKETEYLLSRNNGLFIFSEDYAEMAQVIQLCLECPMLIKRMKKGAQLLRDQCLSYELIAKTTINDIGNQVTRHPLLKVKSLQP